MGGGIAVMTADHPERPHYLVDFDRTLAYYESWDVSGPALGRPIMPNVERVKRWLAEGTEVRIFTARASGTNPRRDKDVEAIKLWCMEQFNEILAVVCEKNFATIAILDDLAMAVEPNTGIMLHEHIHDPLTLDDELSLTDVF